MRSSATAGWSGWASRCRAASRSLRRLMRSSSATAGWSGWASRCLAASRSLRRLMRSSSAIAGWFGLGFALPGGLAFLAPLDALLGDCRPLGLGVARPGSFALRAPLHPFFRGLPLGALAPWLFRAGSLPLLALCSPSLLPAQQFFLFGRLVLRQNDGCGERLGVLRKSGERSRRECEADGGAHDNPKMAFHLTNSSVQRPLRLPTLNS